MKAPEDYMRASEAARTLGVVRQRVYQMIEEGKLPSVRVGGFVLIPKAAVLKAAQNSGK